MIKAATKRMILSILIGTSSVSARADCGGYWPKAIPIYEDLRDGMVKIETSGGPDIPCKSEGSGFIVSVESNKIIIATAKHVIPRDSVCAGKMDISGIFMDGLRDEVPLTVEAISTSDLVYLSAPIKNPADPALINKRKCRFSLGKNATPVNQLLIMGYFPGDRMPLPGAGYIETAPDQGGTRQRICGAINHGMSGGPVIDVNGNVLGLLRERVEKDSFGNEVVEKGFILPADVISTDLKKLSEPSGDLCYNTESVVSSSQKRSNISIPYQLSELNDDHITPPSSDVVKWGVESMLGHKPKPLRYEKQYHRSFKAIDGYKIRSINSIRIESHNFPSEPTPSVSCTTEKDCIKISADKKSLEIDFRLWSGPIGDKTRGWLDMTIITHQEDEETYDAIPTGAGQPNSGRP